jgi:CubicO group peptidase (beta-lactamase class C family)
MQQSVTEQIDRLIEPWNRTDGPGLAVGLYREGELVHGRGVGLADLEQGTPIRIDTVFHLASLAKQVTAFIAALLARAGVLSLDDDLRRHLPMLPPGPAITFRHAIHHTTGLREQWDLLRLAGWRDADLKTTADALALLGRQRAPNFQPGARFQYVNTGYTLIAAAIERITGESFRTIACRFVFGPLGMRNTCFTDDRGEIIPLRAKAYSADRQGRLRTNIPHFETPGPTNLLSTIRDFAAWERNAVSPIVGDRALLEAAMQPLRSRDGTGTQYGYGFILGNFGEHPTVEHAGGDAAFRAYHVRVPGQRLAVLVLANCLDISPSRLARDILRLVLPVADQDRPVSVTPALDPRASQCPRIIGLYRHSESKLNCRVELRNDRLLMETSGASYELVPLGGNQFRLADLDVTVTFDLPAEGLAAAMIVRLSGDTENRCIRVDLDAEAGGAPLDGYAGAYESEDLDVSYTVARSEHGLIVRGPRGLAVRLRRVQGDSFAAADTTIDVQFQRNADDCVTGFLLSSERAWNIDFVRCAGPGLPS